MKWGQVAEHHPRVAIVASGPSARGIQIPGGVTIIAVNGAIDWLDRADYWFTLDPSEANWSRMHHQRPGVLYVAAVPDNFGTRAAETAVMRRPALDGVRYLHRVTGDGHGSLRCKPGLCEDIGGIHTGNSAYGALGLAFHFRARRIALFGVDASPDPRIEGGLPGNLAHLPELFSSTLSQLQAAGAEVVNGSPNSQVEAFPRMAPHEAMEWLRAPTC
jgi:hypothetical protein